MSCLDGRLSKKNILSRPTEFKAVFNSSIRSRDEYLQVLGRNNSLDYARLGMVISRKHIHTAVGRNGVKRVIRESFRHNQDRLQGLDIVIILLGPVDRKSNPALFASLERHWQEIVRCKKS